MSVQLVRETRSEDWFPFPARTAGEKATLLCLPFAGGGASRFLPLARLLGPTIAALPAQFPGRENRFDDPAYTDAAALIADLTTAALKYADRPYAILGYSLGASYAFELVRSLAAAGAPAPLALFAVASPAPHTRSAVRLGEATDAVLLEQVQKWQAIPEEMLADTELLGMALGTLRTDLGTWERHDHAASAMIDRPVFVYSGHADPTVNRPQLAGWRVRTSAATRFRTFTGEHFFGFDEPAVLAAAITADLAIAGGW